MPSEHANWEGAPGPLPEGSWSFRSGRRKAARQGRAARPTCRSRNSAARSGRIHVKIDPGPTEFQRNSVDLDPGMGARRGPE